VALVRTDVSEELGASFIRVTKICELGTTKVATSNRPTQQRNTVTLMKEAPGSSETSVLIRATRRNNPEDTILHRNRWMTVFKWMLKDVIAAYGWIHLALKRGQLVTDLKTKKNWRLLGCYASWLL
jgi:hypothetical protein